MEWLLSGRGTKTLPTAAHAVAQAKTGRDGELEALPFARSSMRVVRRGDIIAMAGDMTDSFARIHKGMVSGSVTLADGRDFIIEIIPAGGFIGELEVLRRQALTLEYRAATECELHMFDGRLLREKYESEPAFRERMLMKALARVAELEKRIISNAASGLQSRLAATLLRLSKIYSTGKGEEDGELIISQQDLASTLPASREKVNQCLRRLKENKIIDGSQGRIRILNRKALETYAEQGAFEA